MLQTLIAWGPAVLWAAVLFLLSELHGVPRSELAALNDKVVHLFLYGVLGAALGWGKRRSRPRIPHWSVLGVGFVYGAVDEWHQHFVPRRDPSLADFGADVVGVAVGYLLLLGAFRYFAGRRTADSPADGGTTHRDAMESPEGRPDR